MTEPNPGFPANAVASSIALVVIRPQQDVEMLF